MKRKIFWTVGVLTALLLSGCGAKPAERIKPVAVELEDAVESKAAADQEIVIETDRADVPEETDAPEAEKPSAPEQEGTEPVRLLFSGDVLLSNYVVSAYENAGGIHGVLDDGYRQLIDDADFFFVNEEFPFSDRGTQAPDKQYTFRLDPKKVSMLLEMGVDAVSLANNHALDFGTDALLDTCDTLDGAGILRTGAGASLDEAKRAVETEIQGKKVAIIGATRVIPVAEWATFGDNPGMLATYDPTILLEEIKTLDETNDYVIVFVHWGIERAEHPEEYQRKMGQQYIDAGADIVIGSHPHVLQGVEYYKDKPIVYSLGNFVFGSSIPRTMLLEVELGGDGTLAVHEGETDTEEHTSDIALTVHPGTSNGGYTRMLDTEQEKKEFYNYLESISYGVTFEEGAVRPQP